MYIDLKTLNKVLNEFYGNAFQNDLLSEHNYHLDTFDVWTGVDQQICCRQEDNIKLWVHLIAGEVISLEFTRAKDSIEDYLAIWSQKMQVPLDDALSEFLN